MVREEAPDVEVLTQISSLIAALEQVAAIVLQYHVEYRVRASIENRDESEESVAELRVAVQRFLGTRRRR
jgi:DNA-binding FrmR family transcriptional regulator